MKNLILIIVVLGFVKVGFIGCSSNSGQKGTTESKAVDVYQCPMDCENGKTYDKQGKCPVCEMDMEKK